MRRTGIVTIALVLTVAASALATSGSSTKRATPAPQVQAQPLVQSAPAKEWGEISAHLGAIDSTVARLARPSKPGIWTILLPALIAFVGVVIGGVINSISQHIAAAARAKTELGAAAVQWQIKQLAELYGPLYALLQQSHTLYRDMNKVLEKQDPGRFRMMAAEAGESKYLDNQVFKINVEGKWVQFRTILHLQDVYGGNFGVEPYFDEFVSIGEQIVKVIRDKAGYARPEELELSEVFGKYLAHYSVLAKLHTALKDKARQTKFPVDHWAVFPNEMQDLVARGFCAISDDLKEWRARAR